MISCPKHKRFESAKYKAFVRTLPCVICHKTPSECHHVRISHNAGIGIKPDDTWSIPLCTNHHRGIHDSGQKTFCFIKEIDLYRELFLTAKAFIEEQLN